MGESGGGQMNGGTKEGMDARVADAGANGPQYAHFKYSILIGDEVTVMMPKGARIVHVDQQPLQPQGTLQLWALVDKRADIVQRKLRVFGTGHACYGQPGVFLGTVLYNGGALVWHVYDAGEVREVR